MRVFGRGQDIADLAPEVRREVAVVACRDDALAGVSPQEPRGEAPTGQLRFTMAWREIDHQPIDLAALDGFKVLGN